MHRREFIARSVACLALPGRTLARVGSGSDYMGPLFDAHLHFPLSRELPPAEWVPAWTRRGISAAFVFSNPRFLQQTLKLRQANTEFVYPFAHVPVSDFQLLLNDETLRSLQEQLDTGVMRGIAEVPLRHPRVRNVDDVPVDGAVPMKMYELAAGKTIPITLHVDHAYAAELDRAVGRNPNTTFIWAHAGDGPPQRVRELMAKHQNLYADLSCRNPQFRRRIPVRDQSLADDTGELQPEWKSLLADFAGRLLFGSDMAGLFPERLGVIDEVIQFYRSVLGQLGEQAAAKIAHQNAKTLIGPNSPQTGGSAGDKPERRSTW